MFLQHRNSGKPVIGILANIETIESAPFLGLEKASLQQNYIDSIITAGAVPIVLPVVQDLSLIEAQINLIDGLLLSGGGDIQPLLYGEEPHPDLGSIQPARDRAEMEALSIAYRQEKPILGICRGLQLINVAFGGTLYQDLNQHVTDVRIKHAQQTPIHVPFHSIEIEPSTHLYQIFRQKQIGVNSFHHQAIKRLASGFIVSARSKDGIIEGIEKADYPFLMGVQWHPERMINHDVNMLNLFKAFIDRVYSQAN